MGSQSCDGVTDGSGVASCPIAVTQIPALLGYPITATFA